MTEFGIDKIVLRVVRLPLRKPFVTSFGSITSRDHVIVELRGGGISGWGESAFQNFPFYCHETLKTGLEIIKDFVVPVFFQVRPTEPAELSVGLKNIVGNFIARSGVEMAFWDWLARAQGKPLWRFLGGVRNEIPVGVSIGVSSSIACLCDEIEEYLKKGYQRIKIKIMPGYDLEPVRGVRRHFPSLPLTVDANSAYTLEDMAMLKQLDDFDLLMIEQPLREGDLYEHSLLQRELKTSICLDESICCFEDAKAAVALGSCRVINMKTGRMGGLHEALAIHEFAVANQIGMWCGGMLETGIGRAANMAISTLPGFIYPGDVSESARYADFDLVQPEIKLTERGTLQLLERAGIGYEVDIDVLDRCTLSRLEIDSPKNSG